MVLSHRTLDERWRVKVCWVVYAVYIYAVYFVGWHVLL